MHIYGAMSSKFLKIRWSVPKAKVIGFVDLSQSLNIQVTATRITLDIFSKKLVSLKSQLEKLFKSSNILL